MPSLAGKWDVGSLGLAVPKSQGCDQGLKRRLRSSDTQTTRTPAQMGNGSQVVVITGAYDFGIPLTSNLGCCYPDIALEVIIFLLSTVINVQFGAWLLVLRSLISLQHWDLTTTFYASGVIEKEV